jgi:hypothetical protein
VVVAALVVLLLGWRGVRDAELATQQIPYLASGGLIGLFLLGLGGTLWLSADLRDEWRKLDDIHAALMPDQVDGAPGSNGAAIAKPPSAGRPVAARPLRGHERR